MPSLLPTIPSDRSRATAPARSRSPAPRPRRSAIQGVPGRLPVHGCGWWGRTCERQAATVRQDRPSNQGAKVLLLNLSDGGRAEVVVGQRDAQNRRVQGAPIDPKRSTPAQMLRNESIRPAQMCSDGPQSLSIPSVSKAGHPSLSLTCVRRSPRPPSPPAKAHTYPRLTHTIRPSRTHRQPMAWTRSLRKQQQQQRGA